jgi:hypothetical protein
VTFGCELKGSSMSDTPTSLTLKDYDAHVLSIGMVAGLWAAFESSIDNNSFALARIKEEILACFAANMLRVPPMPFDQHDPSHAAW